MRSKSSDLLKVQSLRDGETCQINWHEDGGGEVTREGDILSLYEVPQFGGEPRFYTSCPLSDAPTLVLIAYSWT